MNRIRQDFPIFHCPSQKSTIKDKQQRFVYLDTGATSQKPQQVIDSIVSFYTSYCAPVHRALYNLAEMATSQYEEARMKVASFIGARHGEEIVFTKGTTEGINFVAQTWALDNLKQGDQIVLTQAEHHANLLPWQRVAERTGAKLVFIPVDPKTYRLSDPCNYLGEKTKIVAVTHDSNVLGQVWDEETKELEKFIKLAHSYGAKVLIDAAQSVVHQKVDVRKLDVDFLTFSGHKMFGPTGIGVLYIKKELHDEVGPYQVGGSMVFSATFQGAKWAASPQKFEAGTPPIAQAIGLGAAVDYINERINYADLQNHEASLIRMVIKELQDMPEITIVGNIPWLKTNGHLVCIALDGVHAHDAAAFLGDKNVAVRVGHHCVQPLVTALGFESLLRVSLGPYNTEEDIEIFLQELKHFLQLWKKSVQ